MPQILIRIIPAHINDIIMEFVDYWDKFILYNVARCFRSAWMDRPSILNYVVLEIRAHFRGHHVDRWLDLKYPLKMKIKLAINYLSYFEVSDPDYTPHKRYTITEALLNSLKRVSKDYAILDTWDVIRPGVIEVTNMLEDVTKIVYKKDKELWRRERIRIYKLLSTLNENFTKLLDEFSKLNPSKKTERSLYYTNGSRMLSFALLIRMDTLSIVKQIFNINQISHLAAD